MDWQCRHGQQSLVENKDMSMNVCINSSHFYQDNFYVQKCRLKASFVILIFHRHEFVNHCQHQKRPVLFCLKFISPKKQSMIRSMSVRLTAFAHKFCGVLDFHYTIFGSTHAWLWEKYRVKPRLTYTKSHFLKNHLLST